MYTLYKQYKNTSAIFVMHVLFTLLFTNTACAGGTTEEVFVPAGKYWSYKGAGVKPVAVHIADFYMDTFPVSIAQSLLSG